jgi:hypothetical protein
LGPLFARDYQHQGEHAGKQGFYILHRNLFYERQGKAKGSCRKFVNHNL